jgi:hypothetical protein
MLSHRDLWSVMAERQVIGMACDIGILIEDKEVAGLYITGIYTSEGYVELPAPVSIDVDAVPSLLNEAQDIYKEATNTKLNRFLDGYGEDYR